MSCLADYGVDKYDIGTGFGHFGIAVEDVSHITFLSFFLLFFCFILHAYFSCLAGKQNCIITGSKNSGTN
jgi:hypothetical protein